MVDLGKHLLDKGLLDRDGHLSGKLDDIVLEIPDPDHPGQQAALVESFLSGPMSLSIGQPGWLYWGVRQFYRLLGLSDPQPVKVGWEHIKAIDVVVHLDVSRQELGLTSLEEAVNRRYIKRLPGA